MKAISLACITCDRETEMLTLTMYFKQYLEAFENDKYFRKLFKYKCQIQLQIL